MIDEIRIMYLSKLGQKGQDLIEYALLLAIVVGIGYLIYTTSGLQTSIQSISQMQEALLLPLQEALLLPQQQLLRVLLN